MLLSCRQAGAALDAQDYTGAAPAYHAGLEEFLYYFLLVKDCGRNKLNVPSDYGSIPSHLACRDGRGLMHEVTMGRLMHSGLRAWCVISSILRQSPQRRLGGR